jgi:hypothetical protein
VMPENSRLVRGGSTAATKISRFHGVDKVVRH